MAQPDINALLAEADQIQDPIKRQARIDEIMKMMLGTGTVPSPARAMLADPVAALPADAGMNDPNSPTNPVNQPGDAVPPIPQIQVPAAPPDTAPVVQPGPTIEAAQQLPEDTSTADQQYLVDKAKLGDKILTPNRPEAFSDDELSAIINNPNALAENPDAQEEIDRRARVDAGGPLSMSDATHDLIRSAGQVVEGVAQIPTSSPIGLAGLLAKGAELATGVSLHGDDILRASQDIQDQNRQAIGISAPRNITESVANILPSVIPVGGNPQGIVQNAAEILTPLVIGGGSKRIMANFITQFAADQAIRKLSQSKDDKYTTIFGKGVVDPNADPTASPIHAEVMKGLIISMAALTGGSLLTPAVTKVLRSTKWMNPPTAPVPVTDVDIHGPKNLYTHETAGDLYKTQFIDDKTVLKSLAKRANIPGYDDVGKLIDQDTQMTALMRVNEAMSTGTLRTNTGSFQVNTTPHQLFQEYSRLPQQMQDDADQYMKNLDYGEVLRQRIAKKQNVSANTTALQQVQQDLQTLVTRTPLVRDFADRYTHITAAVRDFLSQGPNAMLSKKTANNLSMFRKNFVPNDVLQVNPNDGILHRIADSQKLPDQKNMDNWYRQRPDAYVDGIANKANAFEMLSDYTRNALKAKMEHDVRGAYVRGMEGTATGTPTIRLATKSELAKYPERIVEIWKDGKRSKYISSKLQATLLKFDPYVTKHPLMFAGKRLFENTVTGPLSGTFAPVTAIRDMIGGYIQKEPGSVAANPLDVVKAVGNQAWAKAQHAATELLQNKFANLPFLSQQQRNSLAQQTASGYMNSYYHMANSVGGIDASLTKDAILQGRGIMREAMRSVDSVGGKIPGARFLGRSIKGMYHGWEHFFDAIAEAPRFATFEKNVKAGMAPDDAAILARNLTGDTTRSGKVYKQNGRRIEADAINKSATVLAPATAHVADFIRSTTPYYNPMIQSMRKLLRSYQVDPMGTNLRAWSAVGLPAMVALGWNEMLGEDYNKHAFEGRTSQNIANNLYIGVPGLPPDRGIEIPMPLELGLYHSPFTTALYSLMKGGDSEDVNGMMMHMAGTALENSAMVGFPQVITQGAALAGVKAPQSILNPWDWKDEVYTIKEDNAGVLPQNVEAFAKSLFGNVGEAAVQGASAFHDGGPEAFVNELGHTFAKRIPIAKNLLGLTPATSQFTPSSDLQHEKRRALSDFLDLYDEFGQNDKMLRVDKLSTAQGTLPDEDADTFSRYRMSPHTRPNPTNPVVLEYGPMIKSIIESNDEGATGISGRDKLISQQIKQLQSYTAGRADAFRAWQRDTIGKDAEYQKGLADLDQRRAAGLNKKEYTKALKDLDNSVGEAAKIERLTKDLKLDMGKRTDVNTLLTYLNNERTQLAKAQLKLINMVEDKMTTELQAKGMLQPGQRFDVTKHLGSLMPSDLQPEQSPAMVPSVGHQ